MWFFTGKRRFVATCLKCSHQLNHQSIACTKCRTGRIWVYQYLSEGHYGCPLISLECNRCGYMVSIDAHLFCPSCGSKMRVMTRFYERRRRAHGTC
jgi:Zn finger protein HypA/HybF involved in hydrogenase expression